MLTGVSLSHGLKFYDDGSPVEIIEFDDESDSRTGVSLSSSVCVGQLLGGSVKLGTGVSLSPLQRSA